MAEREPIGKKLPFGDDAGKPVSQTVVGVAGDAHFVSLENPDVTQLYFPAKPGDLLGSSFVVRTAVDPKSAIPEALATLKSIDANVQPIAATLPDPLRGKLRGPESTAIAATLLGVCALALACLGLIGVIAYSVSQRARDIGIRVAIGARPMDVLASVLRQFVPPVVIGIALGTATAAALARVLRAVLFGIGALDPLAYFGAIAVFAFAVSLTAWLPARRALRIDPAVSLHCD